jgi:hypothetical protein
LYLQQFDTFWSWSGYSDRKRKSIFCNNIGRIREITLKETYFWRILAIMNHSAPAFGRRPLLERKAKLLCREQFLLMCTM